MLSLAPLTLDGPGRHVDLVPFIAVRHLVEYHRACGKAWRDIALLKADEDGIAEAFLPALLVQGTAAPGRGPAAAGVCKDLRYQFGNLRLSWPRLESWIRSSGGGGIWRRRARSSTSGRRHVCYGCHVYVRGRVGVVGVKLSPRCRVCTMLV